MRTIIAGSRTITDPRQVAAAVAASGFEVTSVISGTAKGVDQLGEAWARRRGIRIRRFPAEWERYGRSAGYRRNEAMAKFAAASPEGGGCLVAVWDGVSRGTRHMIDLARQHGLAVHVHRAAAMPPMPERRQWADWSESLLRLTPDNAFAWAVR